MFKVRREELCLSQSDLDHVMGNADGLVSKWECGDRSPGAFNLTSWATALQCRINIEEHDENINILLTADALNGRAAGVPTSSAQNV